MLLQLKNLSYGFVPDKKILDDISFTLEEGNIYVLMGPNGSGKTSFFNIICGFLKPWEGSILLNSVRIDRLPPYKINRLGVSRTFQDLRAINNLTVKENVILAMPNNPTDRWFKALLPRTFHKSANHELAVKMKDIVEKFFLRDVDGYLVSEISFGQQKLLTLSCCVANGAQILLLDEPVSGIQPEYRVKIANLLKALKKEGNTIFLVEHNTSFINEVADQILFLHEGKISWFETLAQLKENSNLAGVFL